MVKSFIKQAPTLFLMNSSLGVLPIVLCMIMSDFVSDPMAIYINIALGALILLTSYLYLRLEGATIAAYLSTFLLALFGISTFIPHLNLTGSMFSIYAEIGVLIFESILLRKKKYIKTLFKKTNSDQPNQEALTIYDTRDTCSKFTRVLCFPHIVIVSIMVLITSSLNSTADFILLHLLPPLLLGLVWLGNQLFIFMLFFMSEKTDKIPIVDKSGKVIGKRFYFDAILDKNMHISPVVRIAVVYKDLLYLRQRSEQVFFNPQKTDIPLESYVRYGETTDDCVKRLVKEEFNNLTEAEINPRFCIKYLFKNELTSRLIYLYVAYIEDENLLSLFNVEHGKLWTIRQIENNIGKNFFGECFEEEIEQLKCCVNINKLYK